MMIQVELKETDFQFNLNLDEETAIDIGFSESIRTSDIPPYEGSYEAIPSVVAQSLPTRNRWLSSDLVVQAIPYYEVDNTQYGTTAIIGGA